MNVLANILKKNKINKIKVVTYAEEIECELPRLCKGQELFKYVCDILGLRETWFFGLMDEDGNWIDSERKLNRGASIRLLVQVFPENMSDILLNYTRQLFYLQIRQNIIKMDLACEEEVAVLMASYALQETYGDVKNISFPVADFIPPCIMTKYRENINWHSLLMHWWKKLTCMPSSEAIKNYISLAQNLPDFGIVKYMAHDKNKKEFEIGVSAVGIAIDQSNDKKIYRWPEIRKFTISGDWIHLKTISSKCNFRTPLSQDIGLCSSLHRKMFLRFRSPPSIQVQQMLIQSQEEEKQCHEEKLLRQCATSSSDEAGEEGSRPTEVTTGKQSIQLRRWKSFLVPDFFSLGHCEIPQSYKLPKFFPS